MFSFMVSTVHTRKDNPRHSRLPCPLPFCILSCRFFSLLAVVFFRVISSAAKRRPSYADDRARGAYASRSDDELGPTSHDKIA